MLTDEQYNKLKPYRNNIFADAVPASESGNIVSIYISLGNPPPNTNCGGCMRSMLAQLKKVITKYENK